MAKKNLIRILSLALVVVMMLSFVVACTNNPDTGKESDNNESSSASVEESNSGSTPGESDSTTPGAETDENGYVLDSLPEKMDFKGDTLTIMAWGDVEHPEFEVENDPSSAIDKELYGRLVRLKERLNIEIEFIYEDANAKNIDNWSTKVKNQVENERKVDIMAAYSISTATATSKGYTFDLNSDSCKNLDFSKPWWPDKLISEASIKGKLYFVSGDISNNALYMMYTCFVNNQMLEDNKLENPQKFVDSGDWTYEKFIQYCTGIYHDANGNGTKDAVSEGNGASDTFGYMTSGIHVDPWFYGTGAKIVEKDASGNLIPADSFKGEAVVKTIEMLNNLLYTSQDGIYTANVWHQRNFRDENLLFCMDRARISFKVLKDNENLSYSVLPCPKYEAGDKTGYVTVMGNPFTLYALPSYASSTNRAELASTALEALASDSYRTLSPAVFEITFKLKYSDSPESARMFDIIRDSLSFDFGRIYSDVLIGQGDFRNAISGNRNGWTTLIRPKLSLLPNKLQALQKSLVGE